MNIHSSAEDYLECILILQNRIGRVRSIDIAKELEYSKPSVSIAMKRLRENGYIMVDEDGFISLLPSGRKIADNMYERHVLLTELLCMFGVTRQTAVEDACRVEHVISQESYEKILSFMTKLQKEGHDDGN